jgi:hypothetical protein
MADDAFEEDIFDDLYVVAVTGLVYCLLISYPTQLQRRRSSIRCQ